MSQWYCRVGNEEYGPVAEEKLLTWISERRVKKDTLVWKEGMVEWKDAGTLDCFTEAFRTVPPPTQVQPKSIPPNILAKNVKPGKVTAIGGMRLGAGICNILAGVAFCWLFFPIIMIPLGIFEIISASNLLKEQPQKTSSLKTIAILEIVAIITMAGWISIIVGILTLIFLNDQKVKDYIASLLPEEG